MLLPVWSLTEIQASGGDHERRVPAAIADDRLTLASRKQLGARMADGPIPALRPATSLLPFRRASGLSRSGNWPRTRPMSPSPEVAMSQRDGATTTRRPTV